MENYQISAQQLNQIVWRLFVETPEKVKFSADIRCNGQPPLNEILRLFKEQPKNWVIEAEIIKDEIKSDVVVGVLPLDKIENKEEIAPIIKEQKLLDNAPEIEDNKESKDEKK